MAYRGIAAEGLTSPLTHQLYARPFLKPGNRTPATSLRAVQGLEPLLCCRSFAACCNPPALRGYRACASPPPSQLPTQILRRTRHRPRGRTRDAALSLSPCLRLSAGHDRGSRWILLLPAYAVQDARRECCR